MTREEIEDLRLFREAILSRRAIRYIGAFHLFEWTSPIEKLARKTFSVSSILVAKSLEEIIKGKEREKENESNL